MSMQGLCGGGGGGGGGDSSRSSSFEPKVLWLWLQTPGGT